MDESLVSLVKTLLARKDVEAAQRWEDIFIKHRPDVASKPYAAQVSIINHFWRVQLGTLPVSTIDERECLLDDANLEDWTRLFDSYVLPTIIQHKLPVMF